MTNSNCTLASLNFTSKALVLVSRRGEDTEGNDHFLSLRLQRLETEKRTDAITKNLHFEPRASGTNSHLQGVRVRFMAQKTVNYQSSLFRAKLCVDLFQEQGHTVELMRSTETKHG